jgi:threonine dehydrogenase-like Zn-dependent dehydrogenase
VPSIVAVDAASEDVHDRVATLTQGEMADVVFEVTGAPDLISSELDLLHEQGRLVLIGASTGEGTFINFHDVCMRWSRTIIGAHYYSYPQNHDPALPWTPLRHAKLLFQFIESGELELESLITHRFPYAAAPEAYDLLRERRADVMGVLLQWR